MLYINSLTRNTTTGFQSIHMIVISLLLVLIIMRPLFLLFGWECDFLQKRSGKRRLVEQTVGFIPGAKLWAMKKGSPTPVILWPARLIRLWSWSRVCLHMGVTICREMYGNGACNKMLRNIQLKGLLGEVHG